MANAVDIVARIRAVEPSFERAEKQVARKRVPKVIVKRTVETDLVRKLADIPLEILQRIASELK